MWPLEAVADTRGRRGCNRHGVRRVAAASSDRLLSCPDGAPHHPDDLSATRKATNYPPGGDVLVSASEHARLFLVLSSRACRFLNTGRQVRPFFFDPRGL